MIEEAYDDLDEIDDYLSVARSPSKAATYTDRLLDMAFSLDRFPARHQRVAISDPKGRDVRQVPVLRYLVIYVIDESLKRVVVLGFSNARRPPRHLKAALRR